MNPVWNESLLRTLGRWGLGLLVLFVLLALSATPLDIVRLGEIRPVFMLMAIYYWTILRPSLLPPPVVFLIGLILDLLSAYPFGMHALVFVVAQWLTRNQRKFLLGQPFLVIWVGFGLVALGAGLLQWALFDLFNLALLSGKPVLLSILISTLLFPLVVLPLSVVYRALTDDSSAVP